ncbi:MAG: type II secretion system protein N [Halothiobacillaceae bacterium]
MNFFNSTQQLRSLAASPKLQRLLRLTLSVVLLAILMSILARWTWLLLPVTPTEPSVITPAPSANAPATSPLASISSARLWGTAPAVAASSVTQDTRLPLSLRGVLSGQMDGESLAMIEASGSGTKVYRTGDSLPGGAILKDVLIDHVLIERAGNIERLPLPRQNLNPQAVQSAPAAIAPEAPAAPVRLGKLLQQSPAELSKEFRLTPVTEAGKLRGYRLRALRNPDMLQRAGLEADDVLISVNGTSLTQANDLPKFIKDLRTATVIDAVVLRNGSEIPLHLDLNAN